MDKESNDQILDEKELLIKGKKRALRLLERKDYSRKELSDKLKKDGYAEELVEKIIEYIDSYHYLDDIRVAGSYIRSRMGYKSKRELEYMLKQKGIREEEIDSAMEENYKNDDNIPQEEVAIRKYLQKFHVDEDSFYDLSFEEKQKIAAKLYRKGFASEKIRKILQM
ncbi:MAG: regulatory protein RecX [Lachnospiraceae bacterium]|nr:regulatory protein RecX [Lachnospiraceae bacterium]